MSEQRLTGTDSGRESAFSAEEQKFFNGKGFTPPKRCKDCRRAKKGLRGERG